MTASAESQAYDLVIVGGGPGGYVAAIRASQLDLKTALVEKKRVGGICLNWGCIPTKAMLRSAEVLETMQHSANYGVMADNVRLDYPAVLKRKDTIVKVLTDGVSALLKANGVAVVNGHARFTGPTTMEVLAVGESPVGPGGPVYAAPPADGAGVHATLEALAVIIATGSTPATLPIPGAGLSGDSAGAARSQTRRAATMSLGCCTATAATSWIASAWLWQLSSTCTHTRRDPRRRRERGRGRGPDRCVPAPRGPAAGRPTPPTGRGRGRSAHDSLGRPCFVSPPAFSGGGSRTSRRSAAPEAELNPAQAKGAGHLHAHGIDSR